MADKVQSVQELLERAQAAGMPLEKMRFFINQDIREPKCFGIYYDAPADCWVVYKNKADGSRAVRYQGPDEAYAAQQIWDKIQSEIELRRQARVPASFEKRSAPASAGSKALVWVVALAVPAILALILFMGVHNRGLPKQGYYEEDGRVYYCQRVSRWLLYETCDWYLYDEDVWTPVVDELSADLYEDFAYDQGYADYGVEQAFEDTSYYVEPSSSSYDDRGNYRWNDDNDSDWDIFDSWDFDTTDWGSDW